ncbi:MAG: FG-GAP repeat protein [Rhizobacter sp.]|nr:FG-GAP repeat protein [Ferruginibacter sp.]
MRKIIALLFLCASGKLISGQSVGIGTSSPNSSAVLDIQSTSKGALIPRMTTAQRKAIINPEPGLMVFDTDKRTIFMYQSPQWGQLSFINNQLGQLMPRTASDGEQNNYLGKEVSISGDYVISGAVQADLVPGNNQGAAYIFHRKNGDWQQQVKIRASDAANDDYFGFSVGVDGDYSIVGAPGNTGTVTDQGAAYVFLRSGNSWIQQQKLVAPDAGISDQFGYKVSIRGSIAIISSNLDDVGSNVNQGSVYVFTRSGTTWSFTKKITSTDGAANDSFGDDISYKDGLLLVGCPNDNTGKGSAYVYSEYSLPPWGLQQKLIDPAGVSFAGFGSELSINANHAIIGQSGSAKIFAKNNLNFWSIQKTLSLSPTDVYIHGDYALLSRAGDLSTPGTVQIYGRNGSNWLLSRTLTDPEPASASMYPNLFGRSVAMDGFNIVVGAEGKYSFQGELYFINIE